MNAKVIDNGGHAIEGIHFPTPTWAILMATEYANRNGLAEITITDFYKTEEYRRQASRNVRAAETVMSADARANR